MSITIAVGVLLFVFGLWIENEFVMIIGGSIVAAGILLIFSAIAGYGKSEEEKRKIEKKMINDFREGMAKRAEYERNKRIMNDVVNKDMQENIAKGINRSSRK